MSQPSEGADRPRRGPSAGASPQGPLPETRSAGAWDGSPNRVDLGSWRDLLSDLCSEIRSEVGRALAEVASGRASRGDVADVVGLGSGDVTFALDGVAERAVDRWLARVAQAGPISLMTEDFGWRHLGPGPSGKAQALGGFDHGGPRIALDPIDGTRNVMYDLRSAWVVVTFAGPGSDAPSYADVTLGMLSEIPDTRGTGIRELDAVRGQGAFARLLPGGERQPLRAGGDDRLDRGYFPFFGYSPTGRRAAQALCADVFGELQSTHGIDLTSVLDDQYISSGGQLALLALGTYQAIVDARVSLNRLHGLKVQTAKPYDMAGAALIAEEAGCTVTAPDGSPLEFPIDTKTEVEFAGYQNPAAADAITAALRKRLSSSPERE